ncbi:flagellar hook-associated protein 3 [Desulfosporosinus orientis DSM 765]|uniref:Flagellar hook-associated protein 3 n=1 Tax=Desulfosporosinus orientis (strain ATCC 19365 / DSM 765 / NCIMB 8382 / VKM B-1628 / Singapore I) TaxID=768706 RepID=G7WI18_DESOD|nr:flagellar hook-associated protein FlgL [Desulfosporosinus orientis]AET70315.1 flagellar hook-associated protein 3 [Desulfosporosinus orientis DSM 765]
MRITYNTMNYNYLSSLNKTLEKEYNVQSQLADGKALHKPSDDPVKVVRSLRFRTNLSLNEQYTQNISDAQSWMKTTESNMQDLDEIMITIKEKVIQGSTGTNPQEAVQTIGAAVDDMINHIITIGNTKLGNRYIFAGQNDKTEPFTRSVDPITNKDVITYNGDNQKISMPIHPGEADPAQDSVNLTGEDVFGPNMKVITDLFQIKDKLLDGSTEAQEWLSTTGLANLEADTDSILQAHTRLGTRMASYDMAQTILEDSNTIITGDLANNEEVDVAKAIMDYKNAENVYKMSLQIGAKILPMSLADFL